MRPRKSKLSRCLDEYPLWLRKRCSFSYWSCWWTTWHVVRRCVIMGDLWPFHLPLCPEWPLAAMKLQKTKVQLLEKKIKNLRLYFVKIIKKHCLKYLWESYLCKGTETLLTAIWLFAGTALNLAYTRALHSAFFSFQCHPLLFTMLWHFTPVAHRVFLIRS